MLVLQIFFILFSFFIKLQKRCCHGRIQCECIHEHGCLGAPFPLIPVVFIAKVKVTQTTSGRFISLCVVGVLFCRFFKHYFKVMLFFSFHPPPFKKMVVTIFFLKQFFLHNWSDLASNRFRKWINLHLMPN